MDEYVKNLLVKSLESERYWLRDAEEDFQKASERFELARLNAERLQANVASIEAALKEAGGE